MSAILVLDDRATERELLSAVLGRAGHTVLEATTGEQALAIARASKPELIIADVMMPGMNGYEFVRELRTDPSVGETRVVFCTAIYDSDEVRELTESCGVSHTIAKPCEPEEVIRVVSEVLASDDGPAPLLPEQFDREHLRLLNTKLVQKLDELEELNREKQAEQSRAQRELDALTWVGRIRDALDEDRFVLYAQPIVPLTAAGQHSKELLVRMIGHKGEIIAPASFLPAAEKYGLISEIDAWVIQQAASLAANGHRVHANLSADSIGSLDMLLRIERALGETGADPANVVFEITETALMGNIETGEAFARGITDLGCALALDDFGTGYGSFTYLQRLPITFLKIDITFVHDLVTNTANQHLVRATVNIAQGFDQQTVAEGVEDAETLALLREYGVGFAQGFHVGRPARLAPIARTAASPSGG
jgi:EAL domain-containing protein (putative c-di-GMP-specific phosphodiesterase class I)/DNA-binding response OmpR family regulator